MRCWKVIESIRCELAKNQIIEALRRQVETSNNAARDAQAFLLTTQEQQKQNIRTGNNPFINRSFMVRDITMLAQSVQGFKHQTVDNAFGMTMVLFGPYFLRKNDLKLLTFRNINGRVAM